MKTLRYLLPILAVSLFFACAKDEPAPQVLKLSQNSLHFSGKGGAWQITVTSNCDWKIEGTTDWCTTDITEGSKTNKFVVKTDTNNTSKPRSAQLLLTCAQERLTLSVEQDTVSGEYHYKLPVIFHLLYSDENDSVQNVPAEVISRLIAECNNMYSNNIQSIDMNLEIVPAKNDPEGNPLQEEGIQRIYRSGSAQMSCNSFMNNNTKDIDMLWDPNDYINIFLYTFTETNTLGISHLPFTPRDNSLPGLTANYAYYTQLPDFVYCISLNNTYINEADAVKILAHELGHYLGLLHTFSENTCEDTDYCNDTPTYNRTAYEEWLLGLTPPIDFYQVVKRTDCSGTEFISYNIMDYDISYLNQFTADQFLRIRHVLENSPLIPGPKNIILTRSMMDDEKVPAKFVE